MLFEFTKWLTLFPTLKASSSTSSVKILTKSVSLKTSSLTDITSTFRASTPTPRTDKISFVSNYLNLTTVDALIAHLFAAYQVTKNLQENQGLEIYRLFCLTTRILYSFQHRSAAAVSDRESFGRWNAQGFSRYQCQHCHINRKLCHGLIRTHSR